MKTFSHILVPIDYGDASNHALDTALALAENFGATVTLMHASWVPPSVYAGNGEAISWPVGDMAEAARRAFDGALDRAKQRCPQVDGVLVSGEPWRTILDTAAERNSDLIVMGTHGRRWLSRVFLGSVAEKVVRLSPVPVLTISGKAERQAKQEALSASLEGHE